MSDPKTDNDTAASAATDSAADGGMAMYPIFEVTVERSNNAKIVVEVPEYEVAVLKVLHGEVNVEQGDHVFDEERPADAASILEALKRKYNSPQKGDVVGVVYRNAEELGKAANIKVGKSTRPAESLQNDPRKKAAKKAAKK